MNFLSGLFAQNKGIELENVQNSHQSAAMQNGTICESGKNNSLHVCKWCKSVSIILVKVLVK